MAELLGETCEHCGGRVVRLDEDETVLRKVFGKNIREHFPGCPWYCAPIQPQDRIAWRESGE